MLGLCTYVIVVARRPVRNNVTIRRHFIQGQAFCARDALFVILKSNISVVSRVLCRLLRGALCYRATGMSYARKKKNKNARENSLIDLHYKHRNRIRKCNDALNKSSKIATKMMMKISDWNKRFRTEI